MNQELDTSRKCVVLRNGIEIWLSLDTAATLEASLQTISDHKFINISETNTTINTADLVGVFTPDTLEAYHHQKNGEWMCEYGTWHKRDDVCECGRTKAMGMKTV